VLANTIKLLNNVHYHSVNAVGTLRCVQTVSQVILTGSLCRDGAYIGAICSILFGDNEQERANTTPRPTDVAGFLPPSTYPASCCHVHLPVWWWITRSVSTRTHVQLADELMVLCRLHSSRVVMEPIYRVLPECKPLMVSQQIVQKRPSLTNCWLNLIAHYHARGHIIILFEIIIRPHRMHQMPHVAWTVCLCICLLVCMCRAHW